jgi:metal-responsive CopG/Arc/MetJ family transcriptional regulator
MVAPSLSLPEDLDEQLAEESALTGLTRAELIRQALAEYMQRRRRERLINEYVQEAARGYASTAVREEALEMAEAALAAGNEALERAESAPQAETDEAWWR